MTRAEPIFSTERAATACRRALQVSLCCLAGFLTAGAVRAADAVSAAPLFAAALHDLDDKPTSLAVFQGKPLVVNFWARWCAPCRQEIPDLVLARARFKARGVEVVGIAIEDNAAAVRDFSRALAITYPVMLAKKDGITLMQALGNVQAGLPFTLVLDRGGNVAYQKLGIMDAAAIDAAFTAALKR